MSKLTSKEIAEALGVAPSTVSRALNNKGRISDKTRTAIYDYIKENDPDSLYIREEKKSPIVGLVVGKISNEFFAKVIEKLQQLLSTEDIPLIVMYSNYDYEMEKKALRSLVHHNVDCIVAMATKNRTITREELNGIPLITIDECNPLIDDQPDFKVESDQYVGGVLATEELILKGCKRIAYFTNVGLYHIDLKYKAFRDTLDKHNIPFYEDLFIRSGMRSDNSIEDAKLTIEYLLAKNIEFDGIFATSDRRALGVIISLERHGLSCPEDVKVVGYDASTLSESFDITSIYQDIDAITQCCFFNIIKLLGEEVKDYNFNTTAPVYLIRKKTT